MTVGYDATDKQCEECGADVEDYTGHWHASEATLCEDCYEDHIDEWQYRADVVHCVPKAEKEAAQ